MSTIRRPQMKIKKANVCGVFMLRYKNNSFGMNTITSFHGVTSIQQLAMLQIVMLNYDRLGKLDFQPK
jgi:hypothetical protein